MRYHLHHFRHLHCQLPLPTLLSLCFSSSFLSSSSSSSSSLFIMTTFLSSPLSLMTCCCCFSLDALDPDAYEAFQASNNLSDVVQRCLQKKHIKAGVLPGMSKKLSIRASLMTPVKPMLVCINGVNQDLLWRSKKTCDNCGETVPSYIVTYMYDSAPNDKFVLALLPPAMLHPTLNFFPPILLTIQCCLGREG